MKPGLAKQSSAGWKGSACTCMTIKLNFFHSLLHRCTKLSHVTPGSVQSLSRVRLFVTPWVAARQASLSITNSRSLLKPMSIESVMPSNHLILCRPLLLLPPIPPSIRVLSNESTLCMWWPKYWSFSFSISPCSEHPRLISFRMDWLDLLAVQGTLKNLLQHHSSKASIFQHSAFFTRMVACTGCPLCAEHWARHYKHKEEQTLGSCPKKLQGWWGRTQKVVTATSVKNIILNKTQATKQCH